MISNTTWCAIVLGIYVAVSALVLLLLRGGKKRAIASGAVNSLTGAADTPGVQGAAPADGAANTATFNILYGGLTTDGSSLYVADPSTSNNTIRKIQ